MLTTEKYGQLATDESIRKTMESLMKNGIRVFLVNDRKEARTKVLEFIPHKDEVMTMSSVTLTETDIDAPLNESDYYVSVRTMLTNPSLQKMEKQRIWAAPEWSVGSVHALTESGQAVIASMTGSQIPAYAYGSPNVLWVIGTQKIVKNLDEAMDRIERYVLPLENERAMKAYGTGSAINKILIVNKEVVPGRIHIILVKEKLWF